MKHTKGPWLVRENQVITPNKYGHIGPVGLVAEVMTSPQTVEANARLIAAAPELLEHIKGFVKLIETAEELNNAATDSGNSPQKKGVTWLDYRALTQNIRDTAKLLVAKAEALTDQETADEAALRG